MEANPCGAVTKTAVKAEKKRRALSAAEYQMLLAAAPPERRLVYQFLMFTGARRAEAAQLRWGDLRLDGLNPRVDFRSSTTKSGKPESVPLVAGLAVALRTARAARTNTADEAPVFRSIPMVQTLLNDLATVGIDEKDERGRVVVLHSLRHSLATMLAASQVPMSVAQRIMRHRDIRLTAETYTDEALLSMVEAMRALPAMTAPAVEVVDAKATGTDGGKAVPDFVPFEGHKVAQTGNPRSHTPVPKRTEVPVGSPLGTSGHRHRKAPRLGLEPSQIVGWRGRLCGIGHWS